MNEEVIKIENIFYAIKKRWWIILLITIVFTFAASIYSYFVIKPEYQAKVKVFIGKEEGEDINPYYSSSDIAMYQRLMKTYGEIITTRDSTKVALKNIGLSDSDGNASRVKSGILISTSEDTQIMDVSYTSNNKDEVLPILNSITKTFMQKSQELIPNGNVHIIESAREPKGAISPNKKLNILIGFMLGLMVSLGIIFLLDNLDNTIKDAESLEKLLELPVIGSIPHI